LATRKRVESDSDHRLVHRGYIVDVSVRGGGAIDFFVSHAGSDREWAVWLDAVLRDAGYSTITDVYDFRVGENFVLLMSAALERSARVLLVVSPQALDRWMVDLEWTAAIASGRDRLIPIHCRGVRPA
ncbi:MAG: toll/interleukin-1 receptor domain-containing protein, partial [Mycobacterium sp.]